MLADGFSLRWALTNRPGARARYGSPELRKVGVMASGEIRAEFDRMMGEVRGLPAECPEDPTVLLPDLQTIGSRMAYLRDLIEAEAAGAE